MAPETNAFSEREVDGVIILVVNRGLKGEGEYALRERLEVLVRERRVHILINLKQLPYIDSSELGRLIRAHNAVRQAGGRVRLCHLSQRVMDLMKLTHLDTVLDIYGTEEEALAAMKRSGSPDGYPLLPLKVS
jgi:anti-anti-sigma factor